MKKLKYYYSQFSFILVLIVLFSSCNKKTLQQDKTDTQTSFSDLTIADNFDWKLSREIKFSLKPDFSGVLKITSVDGSIIYHKAAVEENSVYDITISVPNTVKQLAINSQIIEVDALKTGASGLVNTASFNLSFGPPFTFNNGFTYSGASVALDENRFMVTYAKWYYGPVAGRIGTKSGNNITYGPEFQIPGTWGYYNMGTNIKKIDDTHVLFAYKTSGTLGAVCVATINGDNISFGTAAIAPYNINFPTVTLLGGNQFSFAVNGDGNKRLYGYIGTISGNNVSLGPVTTMNSIWHLSSYRVDDSRVLFIMQRMSNGNMIGVIGTNNSGTLVLGTPTIIGHSDTQYGHAAMLDGSRFVCTYQDKGDGYRGKAVLCNITGTTITCGAPFVFYNGRTNQTSVTTHDNDNVIISFGKNISGSYSQHCIIGTVNGSNISFANETQLIGQRCTQFSLIKQGVNRYLATMGYQPSSITKGYNFLSAPTIQDTDGDGVADADDDYPNDASRAFDNFFPAAGYGSLGFEDLWPSKGDYDFNDIVVDYRFQTVTNADNEVVEIFAKFPVKASGAYKQNGFGFNLPDASPDFDGHPEKLTISGYNIQEGYITLNGFGHESGQTKPTIIVFDKFFNILANPGSGLGVNTVESAPQVDFDTLNIHMVPNDVFFASDFSLTSWNPFMIVNLTRGHEVHLSDFIPTQLANSQLLGIWDDDSDPLVGKYYKTKLNHPWAIDIPAVFDWPVEKADISHAYLHFAEWAESNGTLYNDWYLDNAGYRNQSLIYNP